MVKISKLNYLASNLKHIERQKLDKCLKTFWNETVDALKFHSGMQDENVDGTVTLITNIIKFWKIINAKSSFEGLRLNDSLRDAISSSTDLCLDNLKMWK